MICGYTYHHKSHTKGSDLWRDHRWCKSEFWVSFYVLYLCFTSYVLYYIYFHTTIERFITLRELCYPKSVLFVLDIYETPKYPQIRYLITRIVLLSKFLGLPKDNGAVCLRFFSSRHSEKFMPYGSSTQMWLKKRTFMRCRKLKSFVFRCTSHIVEVFSTY